MSTPRRVMVDMSATLIHHGHIRILQAAKQMGTVVVALTTNEEVRAMKGYDPELDYEARKEILQSIRYVDEVVPCKWMLDDTFLDEHRIDLLVHGSDNRNPVSPERLVTLPRTPGISSMLLRVRALEAISSMMRREVT